MKNTLLILLFTVATFGQTGTQTMGKLKLTTPDTQPNATQIMTRDVTSQMTGTILKTDFILKDNTPQTKVGGLTIGTNLANANDSWVTFGTSVTNSTVYSAPASAQMNLNLINFGVSGSTSNNLATQYVNIPTWTNAYRLLSVEHSINDSSQAVPLNTFRTNLQNFIANAKSKGWPNNRILIINGNYCTNAPMITTMEAYANEAMAIAKEQGVQYYDAYNYTKNNGGASLLSDGVHPTTVGGLVYARGLIASMQGGMEITNSLTVDNGLTVNGIINADKQITTLGSLKTGTGSNNTPANTVNGDVIVPFTAGIITQHSQAGIIAKYTPIEFAASSFSSTYRNYTEFGRHMFYVANTTRGSQILALDISFNGLVNIPLGLTTSNLSFSGDLNIGFNKFIQYVGTWTNKLNMSDGSGSTVFNNGFSTGTIDFNVSNGVTNASNLALRINNNRSARFYNALNVDGDLNIGFNKFIQYLGNWTNKLNMSDVSGNTVFNNGFSTGTIDFNVSNGVTNASNLALRISANRSVSVSTDLAVTGKITATAGTAPNDVVVVSQLGNYITTSGGQTINDVSGGVGLTVNSDNNTAMYATSDNGVAINAFSNSGAAMIANSDNGVAMFASSNNDTAIQATSANGVAINAFSNSGAAMIANSDNGVAMFASSNNNRAGIFSVSATNTSDIVQFIKGNTTVALIQNDGSIFTKGLKLSSLNTAPSSATATGTTGEVRWDANFMYVCVATNTWKRSEITTW